jgi:glycosyl transferase, family 25
MIEKIAIFVINLEARADRRRDMARELARVGLSAEFFPAIRPADAADFPSLGARGCFLSHLEVLRKSASLNCHVAVLEDDVNFHREFETLWPLALRDLPPDWSMFYAAHQERGLRAGMTKADPGHAIRCTHFVLLNALKISRLIEGLEAILQRPAGHPLGGPMHVDGAYSTIRAQHPELATYLFSPSLGYQRSSRSDIEGQKLFDRYRFLSPGVSAMRRLKASLSKGLGV